MDDCDGFGWIDTLFGIGNLAHAREAWPETALCVIHVKMIRGRRELDHLKGENSPHVVSLIEKDNYNMYTLACHMNGYSQGLIEAITDLMKSSS